MHNWHHSYIIFCCSINDYYHNMESQVFADNGRKLTIAISLLAAAIAYFHPDEYTVDSMPKNVPTEHINVYYDFIIVGSGSAGIAI